MNFILFNPDEMRAQSVGCYGHPNAVTPNIDRLATEGTRFDQCHVQHTVCSPSRCSFMRGWYPHTAGHRTLWHLLRPHEPNLLRYLKQNGYDVHWWGKNDLLARDSFAESVTSFQAPGRGFHGRNPFPKDDPRYYSFLSEAYSGLVEEHCDYASVQGAIDFLQSKPSKPFALYLPLGFPHCPYSAPTHWHDRISPGALPPLLPVVESGKPRYHKLIRETRRLDELDEHTFRKINAVYLGMIGFIDELLGRLLDTLERTGLSKNTTVLFFSDHGDYAGDYGLVEKWPSGLEDVLTRVPLIIRAPGAAAGHVVREPVELFDLMATVLELAGIKPAHTHFARSLVPQLQGEAGDPDRAVFAEGGYDPHERHCFEGKEVAGDIPDDPAHIYYPKGKAQQDHPEAICRCAMIRTATHKLIHRPGEVSELYDLRTDPGELQNLHGRPAQQEVQRALERRLLDWYTHTSDVVPLDVDFRGLPCVG